MKPKHHCKDLHTLSAFVHGCLASLHLLGVAYNVKRGNKLATIIHSAGVAYSIHSMIHHQAECAKLKVDEDG